MSLQQPIGVVFALVPVQFLLVQGLLDDEVGWEVEVYQARAFLSSRMSRDEIDVVVKAWNSLDDLKKSLGMPLGFEGSWLVGRMTGCSGG